MDGNKILEKLSCSKHGQALHYIYALENGAAFAICQMCEDETFSAKGRGDIVAVPSIAFSDFEKREAK